MRTGKSLIFWLAAIILLTMIANLTGKGGGQGMQTGSQLPFSEFMKQAEENKVAEVTVAGTAYRGTVEKISRMAENNGQNKPVVID